ncbi:MAG: NAD+ synthase [Chlamydiota bacterium]
MRYLLAQINPIIGDLAYNTEKILRSIEVAKNSDCDLVIFPEMALTGYPPEDLLLDPSFLSGVEEACHKVEQASRGIGVLVGLVRKSGNRLGKALLNSAAFLLDGKVMGYHDKMLLPTYDVFDERRYFAPGKSPWTFSYKGKKIGVLICEDVWQHGSYLEEAYLEDPVKTLQSASLDLVINIAASPYYFAKHFVRKEVFSPVISTLGCPLLFCNQVGANDSLIFDGRSCVISAKGETLLEAKPFVEEHLLFDDAALSKKALPKEDPTEMLIEALCLGIADYFAKQGFTKAVVGVSGGIDSALVLYLAQKALGKNQVQGLFMPSRFTSKESGEDASFLAKNLEVALETVSIEPLFERYLEVLESAFHKRPFGVTKENLQSRIRGMLLMAYSNQFGHIVLSTGNKSEMALGYATLYGDLCGGLSVLGDLKKTEVYALARWIHRHEGGIIPERILTKEASAELKEGQKDRDTLPPYEVIDQIVEGYLERGEPPEVLAKKRGVDLALTRSLIEKIHQAEYKRRQAPLALRVSRKAFSKGRIYPIVQGFR